MFSALYLRLKEAYERRELLRPIEILQRPFAGLPYPFGSQKSVEDAWYDLAQAGVLAIVGPHVTDSSLTVKPLVKRMIR